MPNPGKTNEAKQRVGSREPLKPTTPLVPLSKIPEPMRRLEHSGLQLWNSAWSAGSTWLKETDYELLQLTCEQMDERDSLRIFVMENMEAWHERAGLRVLERDIQANLVQLGFTPTARQKLGIQEVKAMSKLEELMAKKAKNVATEMVDPSSAS